MRSSNSQKRAMPTMPAGVPAMAVLCLLLAAVACKKSASSEADAAQPADRYKSTGGRGGDGPVAVGGSGGLGSGGIEFGGAGGSGGEATGGATGTGGSGGIDGGIDGGRDAGSGGKPAKDAPIDTDNSGIDGGGMACDDTTSPGRLAVYYYFEGEISSQSVLLHFDVVNFTALSARLSEVTVRYWFTDEGAPAPNVVDQFYVPIPTNTKFLPVTPPRKGADTVLEISYSPGKDAGASFVETRNFNLAFHKNNYAGLFDQTNDYSANPAQLKTFAPNPKITAYVNGVLAWGCEPPPL